MNNRFKELRKQLNLTQIEMANKLGKKPRVVAYYESGERNIDIKVILQLKDIFSINVDWLINGNGDMFVEKETTVPIAPAPDEPFSRVKTFAYSAIRNMSDAEVQDLLKYIEDQKILKEHRQAKKENAS